MAAGKRRRKSLSVAAPFWIFAAAAILLLPPSTPAQGQAAGPSCDEDGQRNSGDTDASSSGPQCWEGTLQAMRKGTSTTIPPMENSSLRRLTTTP